MNDFTSTAYISTCGCRVTLCAPTPIPAGEEAHTPRDEKAMGINLVALANNHTNDWGYEGLAKMERLLDAAGVQHAGAGRNLAQARKAAIVSTLNGRIAMSPPIRAVSIRRSGTTESSPPPNMGGRR